VPAAPIKEEIYNFQSALYPALQTKEVIEGVQRLTPGLIEYLKCHSDKLEMIPWDVFEHLVAEFLAEKGFEDVRLVGRDQQTSADIYAAKSIPLFEKGFRLFVEVKKWKNRIGIEVINEVLGAFISEQQLYGWNAAIVIAKGGFRTLRKFRPPEIALMNVELKQKDDLLQWFEGYQSNKGGLWLPYPKRKMPQS
jgi:HJR/Mrr/RecB family endonuclease